MIVGVCIEHIYIIIFIFYVNLIIKVENGFLFKNSKKYNVQYVFPNSSLQNLSIFFLGLVHVY